MKTIVINKENHDYFCSLFNRKFGNVDRGTGKISLSACKQCELKGYVCDAIYFENESKEINVDEEIYNKLIEYKLMGEK